MKIVLSTIGVQSGTDLQLSLYYLKSFLLRRLAGARRAPAVRIRVFHEEDKAADIARAILKSRPGIVGFSCYIWNIQEILKVCRKLKSIDPSLRTVLGGPEATPRAEELLARERAVDMVVRGEGEETFAELVSRESGDLAGVAGLSFRLGGKVISNPDRTRIKDLDRIPSPYLSGTIDLKDKNIVDLPLETTRGCSFRCSYCFYHKNFPGVRYFPLKRVEKELKMILASKPREVYLMDATFNSDLKRAKKVLRLFIKHNRSSSLHVELKAELVDEELARLLYRANALNIEIGIQSVSPRTLRAVNRGFDRDKFARGIGLLNKHKLFYEIQLIDALPRQSYADLKSSLDWLYSLRPARVVIFPLAVLPGSSLREEAGKYGIVYDRRPPYYAAKSGAMSAPEVRKARKLQFALERLYDSHIFQETLYRLRDEGRIRISDVFEYWVKWESKFKRKCCEYPVFLNRRSPEFLKYISFKRGKPGIYKRLLPGLKKILADYEAAYYN